MNPRQQGDLGEYSAIEWLSSRGYGVFVPIGHSPDVDLIALIDAKAARVQVKTSGFYVNDRWSVAVCTRGVRVPNTPATRSNRAVLSLHSPPPRRGSEAVKRTAL